MHHQPAAANLNPIWLAQSRLRRRKFDECIEVCTAVLDKNPYDQVRIAGFTLVSHSRRANCLERPSLLLLLLAPGRLVLESPCPDAQKLD